MGPGCNMWNQGHIGPLEIQVLASDLFEKKV